MSKGRIAVCDDEMLIRLWLEEHLEEAGFDVVTYETAGDLIASSQETPPDLVLLDLKLPDGSGIDAIPHIKEISPDIPIIMMTAYGEVETAVRAVRAGAHHFLEKPIELEELVLLIEQALEARRLLTEVNLYREGNRWQFSDVALVGRSFALRRIAEVITRLALRGSPANVLIRGESGVGKDVVARAIHARGPRQGRPFIPVNCTALPDSLVESELFGHEAGAFTDAREAKRGLLELADGGTLFLDEVGDMPLAAQAKLLHVLETRTMRRIGGVRDLAVDVHVIAATHRDLEKAVEAGTFREDLFYRLNVVPIEVPPMRERPEDIMPLALHFLDRMAKELRIPERHIHPDAIAAIERYSWPGNARELRNVLERILLLEDEETICLHHLPPEIRALGESSSEGGDAERPMAAAAHGGAFLVLPPGGLNLEELERDLLRQALERTGGNKTQAARLLGLSRDTFRYRVEKYALED